MSHLNVVSESILSGVIPEDQISPTIQSIIDSIKEAQALGKYSIKIPIFTSYSTKRFFIDHGYGVVRLHENHLILFWGEGNWKPDFKRFK